MPLRGFSNSSNTFNSFCKSTQRCGLIANIFQKKYLQCTKYDILHGPEDTPQPVQEPAGEPGGRDPIIPASGSYGHLRELFEAVKDIVQKYIDLKEKVLSPSMFKNYDQIL